MKYGRAPFYLNIDKVRFVAWIGAEGHFISIVRLSLIPQESDIVPASFPCAFPR
jgi:hypothetical protein